MSTPENPAAKRAKDKLVEYLAAGRPEGYYNQSSLAEMESIVDDILEAAKAQVRSVPGPLKGLAPNSCVEDNSYIETQQKLIEELVQEAKALRAQRDTLADACLEAVTHLKALRFNHGNPSKAELTCVAALKESEGTFSRENDPLFEKLKHCFNHLRSLAAQEPGPGNIQALRETLDWIKDEATRLSNQLGQ
jgi:hypothetical protein